MPRPKKFYDPEGFTRVTLKKGSDRQPGGPVAHAHYVQAGGLRVDKNGLPVKRTSIAAHAPIEWDFEHDDPEDLGEGADEVIEDETGIAVSPALDFDEVAAFALKSPSLREALSRLDASGFALHEGPSSENNQLIVGALRVLVDPALVSEHTVTGIVAREVGRAIAIAPKAAARGRDRDTFVRLNTEASLREEGEAVLFAEGVRAEILAAGGPDVGVPYVSAHELALCAAVREGQAPRNDVALELGRTALRPLHEDAQAHYEELWGRVYDLSVSHWGAS